MLEDYPEKVHAKIKSRARKGIPDAFRGTAWKTLAWIQEIKEENKDVNYYDLVKEKGKK